MSSYFANFRNRLLLYIDTITCPIMRPMLCRLATAFALYRLLQQCKLSNQVVAHERPVLALSATKKWRVSLPKPTCSAQQHAQSINLP